MTAIAFDNSYARLPESFFAKVNPAVVPEPALIKVNRPLAETLGLDVAWLESPEGLLFLSGNQLPETAEPIAMVYAGHQFGGWSPQLGDGRAILLGELISADGVRRDVQLKGSGRTPFSRQGDGKAPLGPVIREYLVSEAMAALGIPTTRALAAVTTGEVVHREQPQPGGVLARVAESHVRVGTFQFFHDQGDMELTRQLADYVIDRHYPEARSEKNAYRGLLEGVILRQADLIARWMQVGFIHGVMNTDNMQIAGETIDFGPCAFMEDFDAGTVFSSIDTRGRYAWGNQPSIGQWNLTRLAEALLPLLAVEEKESIAEAEAALQRFGPAFNSRFVDGFCEKIGIPSSEPGTRPEVEKFVTHTFSMMTHQHVDFTLFFRRLTQVAEESSSTDFLMLFDDPKVGEEWLGSWRELFLAQGDTKEGRISSMRRANPIFIPRNHRIEAAIQAGLRGDYTVFEQVNRVLSQPFDEQPENAEFERPAAADERVERTFCGT